MEKINQIRYDDFSSYADREVVPLILPLGLFKLFQIEGPEKCKVNLP